MFFRDLWLIPALLDNLEAEGYSVPTPIQAGAIPVVLAGRDVLGCAQTGTGKTAAFTLPSLQRLCAEPPKGDRRAIRMLVLAPTRELAGQIDDSVGVYGRNLPIRHTVIYGGVSQVHQVERLKRGVDILVATPGRLLDLVGQGFVDLSHVEVFVLDEADHMLNMGFIHDIRKIIALVPKKRQTLFFSATMPPEIRALADNILVAPEMIEVTPVSSTAERVEQAVYFVDRNDKKNLLPFLLDNPAVTSVLVFTRTKHGADRVVRDLERSRIPAAAIHGNKSQNARQRALDAFKRKELRVLVATDIAARGIDVDELSHVINYDLPNEPETYVHRIGRTGRAGASGIAWSFCERDERTYLRDILRLIGRDIPVVEDHPYAPAENWGVDAGPPPRGRQWQGRQSRPAPAKRPERPVGAPASEPRGEGHPRRRRRRRTGGGSDVSRDDRY